MLENRWTRLGREGALTHRTVVFFNKSNKACAYISAPYRDAGRSSLIQRIRAAIIQMPIPDTHGRHIDLAPWPERIDEDGIIRFRNNGRPEYERMRHEEIKPDVVVFCTGYRQEFSLFAPESGYPTARDADVRNIWRRDDPSIGFMGFVRPSLGAIPPLAEMQAQLWILQLLAPGRVGHPLVHGG